MLVGTWMDFDKENNESICGSQKKKVQKIQNIMM